MFQIDDLVEDQMGNKGRVVRIEKDCNYPIYVLMESNDLEVYTEDGKYLTTCENHELNIRKK